MYFCGCKNVYNLKGLLHLVELAFKGKCSEKYSHLARCYYNSSATPAQIFNATVSLMAMDSWDVRNGVVRS